MPESVSGPNNVIFSLGQLELIWFHVVMLPSESGLHSVVSSSIVMHSRKSASGCATTARPSRPTRSGRYSMPASAQASISLSLMGRDASEMSVSPLQNFWKPPPVPETPTVTRTSGATARNSSATASVTGKTVLEPSIATEPERSPVSDESSLLVVVCVVPEGASSSSSPHAAASIATAATRPTRENNPRQRFQSIKGVTFHQARSCAHRLCDGVPLLA